MLASNGEITPPCGLPAVAVRTLPDLVLGFASGQIPRIPLNLVLLKGCSVIGVFWTSFVERIPEQHRANTAQLLDWCKDGKISPHIHANFPLADTAKALQLIEDRKVNGKVDKHRLVSGDEGQPWPLSLATPQRTLRPRVTKES